MHYTMILHVRHQVLMLRLLAGLGRDAGPRERAQAAAALRAIVHELHSPEGAAAAAAAAAGGGGGGGGCSDDEEEEDPAARGYSYLPDSDEGEEDADDEGYGEGDADYRKNFEKYLATQHGIQPSNQVGEEEEDGGGKEEDEEALLQWALSLGGEQALQQHMHACTCACTCTCTCASTSTSTRTCSVIFCSLPHGTLPNLTSHTLP